MPTSLAPKKPKIEQTREKIILAARAVLANPMAHNVSMETVAQAASVSRRTIFNHFPTREDLVFAVTAPMIEEGSRLVAEALARPPAGLGDFFAALFGLWEAWGGGLGVFRNIDLHESPRLHEVHTAYRDDLARLAAASLKAQGLSPARALAVCGLVHSAYLPLLISLDASLPRAELRRRFDTAMAGLVDAVARD